MGLTDGGVIGHTLGAQIGSISSELLHIALTVPETQEH